MLVKGAVNRQSPNSQNLRIQNSVSRQLEITQSSDSIHEHSPIPECEGEPLFTVGWLRPWMAAFGEMPYLHLRMCRASS